jgi:hypothetical protein
MVNPFLPDTHSFGSLESLEKFLAKAETTDRKGPFGFQKGKRMLIGNSSGRQCYLSIDKTLEELYRLSVAEPKKSGKAQIILNKLRFINEKSKSEDHSPEKLKTKLDTKTNQLIEKILIALPREKVTKESAAYPLPQSLIGIVATFIGNGSALTPAALDEFHGMVQSLAAGPEEVTQCWKAAAKNMGIPDAAIEACATTEQLIALVQEEIAHPLIAIYEFFKKHRPQDITVSKNIIQAEKTLSRFELAKLIDNWIRTDTYLKTIERLWFRDLHLRFLPPAICELRNLKELDLMGNQLTTLPPQIDQLAALEKLEINLNKLKDLPMELANLPNLWVLDISANPTLGRLPDVIYNLKITDLWANRINLKEIPPEIRHMNRLARLFLYENSIEILPPEMANLTNLIRLDIGHNKLTELPAFISSFKNLAYLFLDGNRFKLLPPEIGTLPKLSELYCRQNQLESLPEEIGELQQLKELRLNGNPRLTALPASIAQIPTLTLLYIDQAVQKIPPLPRARIITSLTL